MGQIIKTKFKCKTTMSVLVRGMIPPIRRRYGDVDFSKAEAPEWAPKFIEGKWYEGEYETWNWESGYRLNGGWSRYWVIDENGKKEEIDRTRMRILFYTSEELRDVLIDEILN